MSIIVFSHILTISLLYSMIYLFVDFSRKQSQGGPKTLDFYQVIAFKCSSFEGSVTAFMKLKPGQFFSSLVLIGH